MGCCPFLEEGTKYDYCGPRGKKLFPQKVSSFCDTDSWQECIVVTDRRADEEDDLNDDGDD